MKTLKIGFVVYDQHDNEVKRSSYSTSFYETLPPSILKSALGVIASTVEDGYYSITSIETTDNDEQDGL